MAQRILKNNTGGIVPIPDVGQSVPASGQLVIATTDYGKFEGSSDVIVVIGDSTLTVNDGTFDLAISEGTRLIQGGFSRPISDGSDPTIKATVLDEPIESGLNPLIGSNYMRSGSGNGRLAQVDLISGVDRLRVDATVTVQALLGKVVFPFTYLEVLDVGVNGDTNRFQIVPDSIDITTTKTASEVSVNDLAKLIRDDLNADSGFDALYVATTPRYIALVCIEARLVQTIRPNSGDVINTETGSLDTLLGFDVIIDQNLSLALFPHPRDCRKGTINVTGIISVIESGVPPVKLFLMDSGGSIEMNINASAGSPVDFKLTNNPDYNNELDFLVTEFRIESTANSFSIGSNKYIRVNALTNGHRVQIRSVGVLNYETNLKLLEDIHHDFVIGQGSKFDLLSSSGDGSLVAVFARPFFIEKTGSSGTDDDAISTIRDNLVPIQRLRMSVVGFFEP